MIRQGEKERKRERRDRIDIKNSWLLLRYERINVSERTKLIVLLFSKVSSWSNSLYYHSIWLPLIISSPKKILSIRQRFIEPSFHLKYSHQVGLLSSMRMGAYIFFFHQEQYIYIYMFIFIMIMPLRRDDLNNQLSSLRKKSNIFSFSLYIDLIALQFGS